MDASQVKSWIIKSAIIGFVMAFYGLYGASAWEHFVSSSGHGGVFEVGIGYMAMALVGLILSWWLTRSLKPRRQED